MDSENFNLRLFQAKKWISFLNLFSDNKDNIQRIEENFEELQTLNGILKDLRNEGGQDPQNSRLMPGIAAPFEHRVAYQGNHTGGVIYFKILGILYFTHSSVGKFFETSSSLQGKFHKSASDLATFFAKRIFHDADHGSEAKKCNGRFAGLANPERLYSRGCFMLQRNSVC